MATADDVTYTSGTAFHALGLEDADDLAVRAEILRTVMRVIAARRLSSETAASLLGMPSEDLEALTTGRISRFTTDRLLMALRDLGQDVEIRIAPAPDGDGKGRIRVAT